MGWFRSSWRSVKAAIETFDDVRAVIRCLPTEEEQGLLQSFVSTGESLDNLTDVELFCIDLMQVLICPCLAEQSTLEHPTTALGITSLPLG